MTIIKRTFLLILFSSISVLSYGQKKMVEDTIRVEGVCDMCKERIELALDLKGIRFAEWSPESKDLILAYRSDKITEEEIRKAVANAGHDNGDFIAPDSVYRELPECCLYREEDPSAFH